MFIPFSCDSSIIFGFVVILRIFLSFLSFMFLSFFKYGIYKSRQQACE